MENFENWINLLKNQKIYTINSGLHKNKKCIISGETLKRYKCVIIGHVPLDIKYINKIFINTSIYTKTNQNDKTNMKCIKSNKNYNEYLIQYISDCIYRAKIDVILSHYIFHNLNIDDEINTLL